MKHFLVAIISILFILHACSDSSSEQEVSNELIPDQTEEQLEEEEVFDETLGSINQDNKILYDALVPLGSNIQQKEMNLAEDGFRILPKSVISNDRSRNYTLYAEFSVNIGDQRGVIIRTERDYSKETEMQLDKTNYFLITFDNDWNVADRKQIHPKNSISDQFLITSGWYEMAEIDLTWLKIKLENGSITTVDEGNSTFDNSEEGFSEANQFWSNLHEDESF